MQITNAEITAAAQASGAFNAGVGIGLGLALIFGSALVWFVSRIISHNDSDHAEFRREISDLKRDQGIRNNVCDERHQKRKARK